MAVVPMMDSSEDGDEDEEDDSGGRGLAGADFRRGAGAVLLVGFLW